MDSAAIPRHCRLAGIALLCLAVLGGGAAAEERSTREETPDSRFAETAAVEDSKEPLFAACDPFDRERMQFLEERLDSNGTYAKRWWWAWNGVFVVGMGYQGTNAAFEDNRGKRADLIASAAKSAIGLTRNLWSPPTAKLGTDDLPELDGADPERCRQRLQMAETRLRESAEEGHKNRWSWKPHLANVALNMAAGVVVAEMYERDAAYLNAGIGIAIGELRIFTFPWQAEDDVEEYERRFGSSAPQAPETSWRIEPWHQGARLVVSF